MGFSVFMVYKGRNSSMPSYPGSYARRGYVEVDINVLPRYTSHHCGHCYARFGKVIQRQIEGHPMGSAFSVFLQRCWAVFRELFFSRNLDLHTLCIPRRRISFVRLGQWIQADVEQVSIKRRFGFCSGGIYNSVGVVARFSGTFYFPDHQGMWKEGRRGDGVIEKEKS